MRVPLVPGDVGVAERVRCRRKQHQQPADRRLASGCSRMTQLLRCQRRCCRRRHRRPIRFTKTPSRVQPPGPMPARLEPAGALGARGKVVPQAARSTIDRRSTACRPQRWGRDAAAMASARCESATCRHQPAAPRPPELCALRGQGRLAGFGQQQQAGQHETPASGSGCLPLPKKPGDVGQHHEQAHAEMPAARHGTPFEVPRPWAAPAAHATRPRIPPALDCARQQRRAEAPGQVPRLIGVAGRPGAINRSNGACQQGRGRDRPWHRGSSRSARLTGANGGTKRSFQERQRRDFPWWTTATMTTGRVSATLRCRRLPASPKPAALGAARQACGGAQQLSTASSADTSTRFDGLESPTAARRTPPSQPGA